MKNAIFYTVLFVLFILAVPVVAQLLIPKEQDTKVHHLEINPDRTILFDVPFNSATTEKTIETITDLNKKNHEPIYLLLDSPGGYVDPGMTLISAIESSRSPVYTIVYRYCASMCAFLHQYGRQRFMIDRSIILFHPISAGVQGTTDEMEVQLNFMLKQEDKLLNFISRRAGMPAGLFKQMRTNELILEADDAQQMGLNDKIVAIDFTKKSFNSVISKKVAKSLQKLPANAIKKTRTPTVN